MTAAPSALKRTSLYDAHVALGARLVPFGGYDMPVQYAGILKEHDAVRHRAGLFDLSHMGQFELRGERVGEWADTLTVNHVANMKPGAARYNIFTNSHGGAHDDVIFYRLDDRFLLVVNASNADKMWALVHGEKVAGVEPVDHRADSALIAIQGPRALEILTPFADVELSPMKYYSCQTGTVCGRFCVFARTGYTGEDGFELFLGAHDAPFVWETLLARGAGQGLEPCGLGARDVLRLEAGMPLYGNEMSEEITPLAAGLGWAVKFAKPHFTGKASLESLRDLDDYPRIAGLMMDGKVPARGGYRVFAGGNDVGEVRSGSIAPSLGGRNIATVLVDKGVTEPGTAVGVEVRGSQQPARIVAMPFYKRER